MVVIIIIIIIIKNYQLRLPPAKKYYYFYFFDKENDHSCIPKCKTGSIIIIRTNAISINMGYILRI